MKRILTIVSVFIFIWLVFSCGSDVFVFDVNCEDCYYNEPDSADLIVDVTINDENPFVPLVIYKGDVEENIIEYTDTVWAASTYYLYVAVNEYYSIKAKYKKGDNTIYAIDGDKLKTKYVTDVCDTDCYEIKGGILDVRLKD